MFFGRPIHFIHVLITFSSLLWFFRFRMLMCAKVNFENFMVMHHEMGHIEYYMCYSSQHSIFRRGANNAFHEAIGDTITLSMMTQSHLQKIGLLPSVSITKGMFST